MKNLIPLWLFLIPLAGFAQRNAFQGSDFPERQLIQNPEKAEETEILYPGNWDNATSYLLYTTANGYVFGTNEYNDLAKAQRFAVETPYQITGAIFWVAHIEGNSGNVNFNIWDFTETPGQVIASKTVPVSQITATNSLSEAIFIEFDVPVTVQRDYLIGFELSDIENSGIGLVSSANGDGGGLDLAWEQWEDNTWHTILDAFELDVDMAVFPVVIKNGQGPGTDFAGGDGTQENPYQVSNANQLKLVSQFLNAHFIQTADIDLGSEKSGQQTGWTPIGSSGSCFTGTYNGLGHSISRLIINEPAQNFQGLFACLDQAIVKGLTIEEANITGNQYVGALSGKATNSQIEEVHTNGRIKGNTFTGGIAGTLQGGTVLMSSGTNTISGISYTGGITGFATSGVSISRSFSMGTVEGDNHVGGLVGLIGRQEDLEEDQPLIVNGPNGMKLILPPEASEFNTQVSIHEHPASNILKIGQQAASAAIQIDLGNKKYLGSRNNYSFQIPVTLAAVKPERLRVNVKIAEGIILALPGEYNPATKIYTVSTFGMEHGWVLGVADGEPMSVVVSSSLPDKQTGNKDDKVDGWPSLDFTILDDSDHPRPLTEEMIADHFLPVARDALITLQSNGFAAPKLQLDGDGRFQMILIDREHLEGLGSASYYEPPGQQLLGRIFINYPPYTPSLSDPSGWRLKNVIIHESLHAVQWGYNFKHHDDNSVYSGNVKMYASSAYLEGTASLVGSVYESRGTITTGHVRVDPDFPAHNLGHPVDDFIYSSPYAKQDFFAFLAKAYFNGSLTFIDKMFRAIADLAPAKADQATLDYMLTFRKGLNMSLTNQARPLPEAYTEYAMQRLYLHEPEYLLRDSENPATDGFFARNTLAQNLLTEGTTYKQWRSDQDDRIDFDELSLSNIRPLSSAAATFFLPEGLNPETRPDTLDFTITLSGGGSVTDILQEEGIKLLIIRATDQFGTPARTDATLVVKSIKDPIRVSLLDDVTHLVFLIINSYVEEVVASVSISITEETCLPDPNLVGTWIYIDEDDNTISYTFNADGTLVQILYGTEHNWLWCVEGGKLKMFTMHGNPAYLVYKIEGNQLFFYAEEYEVWGLPFTRQ